MNRRQFVTLTGAAACAPFNAHAAYAPEAFVMNTWRQQRNSNAHVIYNFRAAWSLTCDLKAQVLDDLICSEARFAALPIVEVDWDTFGPSDMAQHLKIRRQSTLIALRGKDEVARLEHQPYEEPLRAFLNEVAALR